MTIVVYYVFEIENGEPLLVGKNADVLNGTNMVEDDACGDYEPLERESIVGVVEAAAGIPMEEGMRRVVVRWDEENGYAVIGDVVEGKYVAGVYTPCRAAVTV